MNILRNFCRSLYYEFNTPDTCVEGPQKILPEEIFLKNIFPLLNCFEVAHNISLVSKKWHKLSDDGDLLKFLIYKDIVFKPCDWQNLGLKLDDFQNLEAWDTFPDDIGNILKGLVKSKKAISRIIWMPQGITIGNFGQLFKNKIIREDDDLITYFNREDYYRIDPSIITKFGEIPNQESGFVLMLFEPKSNARFEWISGNILELKTNGISRKPTILETIVCICAFFFKTRKYAYNTLSNNSCQFNEKPICVRIKRYNRFYLEGIFVHFEPEKNKASGQSKNKILRTRSGRRGL